MLQNSRYKSKKIYQFKTQVYLCWLSLH